MAAQPEMLLLLLLLLPLAATFWLSHRAARRDRAALGDETLVGTLLHTSSRRQEWLRAGLLLGAVALIVVGLARPRWGENEEQIKRSGLQMMILLDGSTSMNTEDVQPSRIEAAKNLVFDVLDNLEGNQIGMLMFGSTSYVQFPLTTDLAAARTLIEPMSAQTLALGGSNIAGVIQDGLRAFPIGQIEGRIMVLISDGGDPDPEQDAATIEAAREAAGAGLTIYTIGVGTASGGPIPIYDTFGNITYKEDDNGNRVETTLNEALLQQIASATGGEYFHIDDFAIDRFQQALERSAPVDLTDQTRRRQTERFYVFVGLALLLLLGDVLLGRRGVA